MDHTTLAFIAFILTVLFFFFFTLLDGFDLGIGLVLPFLPQREKALAEIIPFWDGNEVWIITAVGFLFAAFPPLYAAILPLVYLPVLILLIAFIGRAISIESLYHAPAHPSRWYAVLSISSGLIIAGGVVLTAVVAQGINCTGAKITVDLSAAATPVVLLFAVGAAATIVWHGGAYLRMRQVIASSMGIYTVVGIIALLSALLLPVVWGGSGPLRHGAIAGAVVAAAGILGSLLIKKGFLSFAASGVSLGGWWVFAAVFLYEKVFQNGAVDIGTITAPTSSLRLMVPLAALLMVCILLYSRFVYRLYHRTPANSAT